MLLGDPDGANIRLRGHRALASKAKGDLLEPDEEAPVGAEAEGGGILSRKA